MLLLKGVARPARGDSSVSELGPERNQESSKNKAFQQDQIEEVLTRPVGQGGPGMPRGEDMIEGASTRWKGEQLGHRQAKGPQLKDGQTRRTPEAGGALLLPATKRVWFWVLSLPLELLLCFLFMQTPDYNLEDQVSFGGEGVRKPSIPAVFPPVFD